MAVIAEKKNFHAWISLFLVFLLSLALPSGAPAFAVPERLEYSIRWEFIHAGNSVLEIAPEGGKTLKIVSRAWSSKFLSIFYKVEDRIEVLVEESSYLPFRYRLDLREGRHRKDREVLYLREMGKIVLNNRHKDEIKEFDAQGAVYDPISAFYWIREMDLEVGRPLFVRVFDNGKLYDVEVQVLKKERVSVPAGTFDTVMVKPILKSEGIFMRKGDVYIWLTDDERKVPVKMKSKVKVGAINAVLVGGVY
jgi:hypothetical protein